MHQFTNLFWNKILHVSDSSSVHHQESYIVHIAMVYAVQDWSRSVLILLASCQQTCMTYNIAVCTVLDSSWWTEELSETCRFLFQDKFEKLVRLVDFIIRNIGRTSWHFLGTSLNTSKLCHLQEGINVLHMSVYYDGILKIQIIKKNVNRFPSVPLQHWLVKYFIITINTKDWTL